MDRVLSVASLGHAIQYDGLAQVRHYWLTTATGLLWLIELRATSHNVGRPAAYDFGDQGDPYHAETVVDCLAITRDGIIDVVLKRFDTVTLRTASLEEWERHYKEGRLTEGMVRAHSLRYGSP